MVPLLDRETGFYLSTRASQTRVKEFKFLQPPYLQRYADTLVRKDTPLHNWFWFVSGTIVCICRLN